MYLILGTIWISLLFPITAAAKDSGIHYTTHQITVLDSPAYSIFMDDQSESAAQTYFTDDSLVIHYMPKQGEALSETPVVTVQGDVLCVLSDNTLELNRISSNVTVQFEAQGTSAFSQAQRTGGVLSLWNWLILLIAVIAAISLAILAVHRARDK